MMIDLSLPQVISASPLTSSPDGLVRPDLRRSSVSQRRVAVPEAYLRANDVKNPQRGARPWH